MATGANNSHEHTSQTSASDHGIAAAIKSQLLLAESFDRWLVQKVDAGALNDIIFRVQQRLDSHRRWLAAAEEAPSSILEDAESWDMDARVQPGDGLTILVTGPGSGEPIRTTAKDKSELRDLMSDNYLGYMIKICRALANTQATMRSLLQAAMELGEESSHLTQPPEITVKTYIRSLQEYNDIKDIGQQLIGLVAENRGVPVRTLYEDGQYGVSLPQ